MQSCSLAATFFDCTKKVAERNADEIDGECKKAK
jgi:hypothetical protein